MSPILGTLASQFSGKSFGSFESIATANGTGSATNITFSSIPSTYTHLQIRLVGNNTGENYRQYYYMRFNSDADNNYSFQRLYATASTAISDYGTDTGYAVLGEQPGLFGGGVAGGIIDILDYTSTSKRKSFRNFTGMATGSTNNNINHIVGMWNNTSAISSITLIAGEPWNNTTKIALYGIKGS